MPSTKRYFENFSILLPQEDDVIKGTGILDTFMDRLDDLLDGIMMTPFCNSAGDDYRALTESMVSRKGKKQKSA